MSLRAIYPFPEDREVVAPEPEFRTLRPNDIEPIRQFAARTGVFSEEELDCLVWDLSRFLETPDPDDEILVYGMQEPLGLIHFGPLCISVAGWALHWILTDPDVQGRGIASGLIRAMESRLRTRRARIVQIETSARKEYLKPRQLYERHGYSLVAVVPGYYAKGDDKCIFLKTL
jgi:GNAT superfamily N-acetyltransferase